MIRRTCFLNEGDCYPSPVPHAVMIPEQKDAQTQAMTDEAGNVAWRATNDPFGDASIDAASTTTLNVRFPGQYYDQ